MQNRTEKQNKSSIIFNGYTQHEGHVQCPHFNTSYRVSLSRVIFLADCG
jgi:hypothetical protein